MSNLVPAQQQLFLVEKQIELDGVEMGVLEKLEENHERGF